MRRKLLVAVSLALLGLAAPAPASSAPGGAFTCDFALSNDLGPTDIAPAIERDRMYQTARPGFERKFIPLRIDPLTGTLYSGGRYLFDTEEAARHYHTWLFRDYILDGTAFYDRPYFLGEECHAWSVIGAEDFRAYDDHQIVLRTEWFVVPSANQRPRLEGLWPELRQRALARGLTGLWLLYDKPADLVGLVYFGDRLVPPAPDSIDTLSLLALELSEPLGRLLEEQGWTRRFDRTQYVLTVWFPFALGDHGRPSVWPNSPPLPLPYPGDGVCEVSRGESHLTAPTDCRPTCGDGIANGGETTRDCPGDVRPFKQEEYAEPFG